MLFDGLNIHDLYLGIELISLLFRGFGERADNSYTYLQLMSLWAWLTYSTSYSWLVIKMPLSLTLWQHAYSLNMLLVVQETADTFGLLCLLVLFLSSQLLSRNYMLSVFNLSSQAATYEISSGTATTVNSNSVKSLSLTSSTFQHLTNLLRSNLTTLKSTLRDR